jgi:hypothetical protein
MVGLCEQKIGKFVKVIVTYFKILSKYFPEGFSETMENLVITSLRAKIRTRELRRRKYVVVVII